MDIKIGVAVPINNYRFLDQSTIETSLAAAVTVGDEFIVTNTNSLSYLFPHTGIRAGFYKVIIDDDNYIRETAYIESFTTSGAYDKIMLSRPLLKAHTQNTRVSIDKVGLADGWSLAGDAYSEGQEKLLVSDIPDIIDRRAQKLYYAGSDLIGKISQVLRSNLSIGGTAYFRQGCIWQYNKTAADGAFVGYLFSRNWNDVGNHSYNTTAIFSVSTILATTSWADTSVVRSFAKAGTFLSNPFTVGIIFEGAGTGYCYLAGLYLEHAMGTTTESTGVYTLDQIPDIGVSVTTTKGRGNRETTELFNGDSISHKQYKESKYSVTLQFRHAKTVDIRKLLEWQRGGNYLNLHMGSDWEDLVPRVLTGKILPPINTHDFWALDRASFSLKFMEI